MPALDYGTLGYKGLSYSRLETAHSCYRKYQIENSLGLSERTDTVTFSYGHAVAAGVQEYLTSKDAKLAVIKCAMAYTNPWKDLGTSNEQKKKKNIGYAIQAVERFIQLWNSQLPNELDELKDYELAWVEIDGKKIEGIELQFRILLDNDFVYEGHIDVVMRHKVTGEYAVLELKTSGFSTVNDALFANSNQALGYSIVVDKAVHGLAQSSYKVFYMVYCSPIQDWILKCYPKQVKRRLDWINDLIRDCEVIEYYEQSAKNDGIPYPTDGGSCFDFFRPCRYFSTCTMEDDNLILLYKKADKEEAFVEEDNVHYEFTLEEIINRQIELADTRAGITGLDTDELIPITEIM